MQVDASSFRLDGRVAVVTGAARGIGAAIAETLAGAGARLALCDRDAGALDERAAAMSESGTDTVAAVLDVRDKPAVEAFVADVAERLGHIDVLVNNAGGGFKADFLDVSDKGQAALVDENFTSATNFIRAVVPTMPAPRPDRDGGGSIVNITSIEAHRAGPGFAVYSAMKAALTNLTMSLALELAPRHVRVNAIAPDMIPTPGVGELAASTPLPYAGDPADVAAAALYLASNASRFVTGVTLHVDGGTRAAGGWRQVDGSWFAT